MAKTPQSQAPTGQAPTGQAPKAQGVQTRNAQGVQCRKAQGVQAQSIQVAQTQTAAPAKGTTQSAKSSEIILRTRLEDLQNELRPVTTKVVQFCRSRIPRNPAESPAFVLNYHPTKDAKPFSQKNVLLVMPTSNLDKIDLLEKHIRHAIPKVVKGVSGVGEQPYDIAGPTGVINRVRNAVRDVTNNSDLMNTVVNGGIGTIVVGAIESFIMRPHAGGTDVPIDYGVVVRCTIPLVVKNGTLRSGAWAWEMDVSDGGVVPEDYWRFTEETYGFLDEEREGKRPMHGKETVGDLLQDRLKRYGVKAGDWHKDLVFVLVGDEKVFMPRKTLLEVPLKRLVAGSGEGAGGVAAPGASALKSSGPVPKSSK